MFRLRGSRRGRIERQRLFRFLERSRRLDRWFRRGIVLVTLAAIVGMVAAVPRARYLANAAAIRSRRLAWRAVGIEMSRAEIDAESARLRKHGEAETRRQFEGVFAKLKPPVKRLMTYAGNDPATGVFRCGNFNLTLLLPSKVFSADDHGRSYRLKPNTRSVWLRNVSIPGIPLTFFLVPDGPGLAEAMEGTSAVLVPGSAQTTNSWGLRGPEPNPAAPVRGIVLGDSFMQGLFVGDEHTPPECLRRYLQDELNATVSLLNTGHLGYSPEQEYYTLFEYADRFHPQFVVLNLFANDFGDTFEVAAGGGDWEEGKFWLGEITRFCERRGILMVTSTAPLEMQLGGRRFAGFYPGLAVNALGRAGTLHVDPIEEFVNLNLKLVIAGERAGKRPSSSPLFNGVIRDGHFSAIGSELWARVIGRRLVLLLNQHGASHPSEARAEVEDGNE